MRGYGRTLTRQERADRIDRACARFNPPQPVDDSMVRRIAMEAADAERMVIEATVEDAGSITQAALVLEVQRVTIQRKRKKWQTTDQQDDDSKRIHIPASVRALCRWAGGARSAGGPLRRAAVHKRRR